MRVESPSKQHARAAEKILKRRAKANSNEYPTAEADEADDEELENEETLEDGNEVEGAKVVVDDEVDTEDEDDVVDEDEDEEDEDPYADLGRKQLKMLCDKRVPKIEYKAKATKEQLIALLKGE